MPNWTDTTYKFKGTKEQAQDLKWKLDELQSCNEPRVKSDFGKMWCGCLVDILGGKWDEVPCRGEICEHEIDGDTVTMRIEFAWSEPPAFRHFIESRYEGSKVFYTDENGKRCAQYYLVIRTKRRQKPVHQTEQVRQGTIDFTEPETVQEHEPIEDTVTINVPVAETEQEQTQQPEQQKPVETDGKKRRVNRSIYGEIRCDYLNPEGYWTVDAWNSKFEDDMEEEGRVIAAIDSETAKVFYVDGCAKSDPYAQEVIDGKIREIRMEQEERQVQAMLDAVAV